MVEGQVPIAADVLLLAAGFGTRLGKLTAEIPKPLVQVAGRALVDRNLELLGRAGFRRVILNLHYRAEQIQNFVGDGSAWGLCVEYSHEPVLLDTGGAIKQIQSRLKFDNLFTVNSDIILGSDFSFRKLLAHHRSQEPSAAATLVLREDPEAEAFGAVGVDAAGRICRFLGTTYVDHPVRATLMYTGVQVLSTSLLDQMPPAGSIFSITKDTYPSALAAGAVLSSIRYQGLWNDVGTPERLAEAEQILRNR
ncbi:MAG: nucleotidyltransferase family protein [Bdellovibrionales bacterium]|nr:nucleotidyltransferase family protein [Bdellovibrionales bacterium]